MSKFNVGDKVKRIDNHTTLNKGSIYTIERLVADAYGSEWFYVYGCEYPVSGDFFKLVEALRYDSPPPIRPTASESTSPRGPTITNTKQEGGIKHDENKPRMDLLSTVWIEGVANVLTFGARKYDAHNWRKGLARSRLLGACLRHIFSYLSGEDYDKETGLLHLHHASCCLMFASELHVTRPDLDDRYKPEKKE